MKLVGGAGFAPAHYLKHIPRHVRLGADPLNRAVSVIGLPAILESLAEISPRTTMV